MLGLDDDDFDVFDFPPTLTPHPTSQADAQSVPLPPSLVVMSPSNLAQSLRVYSFPSFFESPSSAAASRGFSPLCEISYPNSLNRLISSITPSPFPSTSSLTALTESVISPPVPTRTPSPSAESHRVVSPFHLHLLDLEQRSVIATTSEGCSHSDRINGVVWISETRLISHSDDGAVRIWKLNLQEDSKDEDECEGEDGQQPQQQPQKYQKTTTTIVYVGDIEEREIESHKVGESENEESEGEGRVGKKEYAQYRWLGLGYLSVLNLLFRAGIGMTDSLQSTVAFVDLETRKEVFSRNYSRKAQYGVDVPFGDGKMVFTGGNDMILRVWELNYRPVQMSQSLKSPIIQVKAFPERNVVLAMLLNGHVSVRDLRYISAELKEFEAHPGRPSYGRALNARRQCALSYAGNNVCVSTCATDNGPFSVWRMDGKILHQRHDACWGVGTSHVDLPLAFGLQEPVTNRASMVSSDDFENFRTLRVQFVNGEILVYGPLVTSPLNHLEGAESVVSVPASSVDGEIVHQVLLGVATKIPRSCLLDLYVLFRKLGLDSQALLVCRVLQLADYAVLKVTAMLQEALERLEEKKMSDLDLASLDPFTNACLLVLAKHWEEIRAWEQARVRLSDIGALALLERIVSEPSSTSTENKLSWPTFSSLTTDHFAQLWSSAGDCPHSDCDITVKSHDAEFPAHLGVLVAKYNFFHRSFSFGGSDDLIRTRVLVVDVLNAAVLRELLRFAYCGVIASRRVDVLMQLVRHARMYREIDLMAAVIAAMYTVEKVEEQLRESSESRLLLSDDPEVFSVVSKVWIHHLDVLSEESVQSMIREERWRT